MERVEAELFTDGGNDAVVRLPGRDFPGVLIQGDTLSILRTPRRPGRKAPALHGRARRPRNPSPLLLIPDRSPRRTKAPEHGS
ncbi:DUF6959 family protein [Streptomyces virginiae]|uniref:DUF6959 family protein n=1 Tax=Streptomyces virginiae TaxID=1961 RepID=UPI0036BDBFB8